MGRVSSETHHMLEMALRRAHKEGRFEIVGMTYQDAWKLQRSFASYLASLRNVIRSHLASPERKANAREMLDLRSDLIINAERIKPQDGGRIIIRLRDSAERNQALRRALATPPGQDREPSRNEILGALEAELSAKPGEATRAKKLR